MPRLRLRPASSDFDRPDRHPSLSVRRRAPVDQQREASTRWSATARTAARKPPRATRGAPASTATARTGVPGTRACRRRAGPVVRATAPARPIPGDVHHRTRSLSAGPELVVALGEARVDRGVDRAAARRAQVHPDVGPGPVAAQAADLDLGTGPVRRGQEHQCSPVAADVEHHRSSVGSVAVVRPVDPVPVWRAHTATSKPEWGVSRYGNEDRKLGADVPSVSSDAAASGVKLGATSG